MRYIYLFFVLFSFVSFASAQNDTVPYIYAPQPNEFDGLKPIDKSELKVSVAGFTSSTLRESPGIVTLITREEIERMGARDLVEILRTVVSFELSMDLLPALTVRGNAVNEGKILISIDGHILNALSTGYNYIAQRFPATNIDRIEIIRGAGSAIYGGQAGLAVVNVYTKKQTENQEVFASNTTGATGNGLQRIHFEGFVTAQFKNKVQMSFAASQAQTKTSDRNFYNPDYGLYLENSKYSQLDAQNLNIGLKYKNLTIDFLQNNTAISTPELLGVKMDMKATMFLMSYAINIAPKLILQTKASYRVQKPFYVSDVSWRIVTLGRFNTKDVQARGTAYLTYQPTKNITFSGGVEAFRDKASYPQTTFIFTRSNNPEVKYDNIGIFGEANIQTKYANITVGARTDRYATIEPVVVPRVAITKAFSKVHFKGLYTEAFKTPTLLNIELERASQPIKPEKFRLIEFEAGVKIGKNLQIIANAYDILVRDYITRNELNIVKADIDFTNIGNVATRGIEAEARYTNKNNTFSVNVAYSYYKIIENQQLLSLVGVRQVLPGTPAHKAVLQVFAKPFKKFQVNAIFMYLTNKFRGSTLQPKLAQQFLDEQHLNIYTQYNEVWNKNFSIGLGCYNALDKMHWLISTKKDYISELYTPTQGREFYVRLIYHVK